LQGRCYTSHLLPWGHLSLVTRASLYLIFASLGPLIFYPGCSLQRHSYSHWALVARALLHLIFASLGPLIFGAVAPHICLLGALVTRALLHLVFASLWPLIFHPEALVARALLHLTFASLGPLIACYKGKPPWGDCYKGAVTPQTYLPP